MKKRLVWIDLLRFIGIIDIIFMHVVGNTINTFDGLSDNAKVVYTCVAFLFEFSIPLFIMISGMMFLKKENLSYKEMFNKYCLKIIITLLIVGSLMIIMEEFFTTKSINIIIVFKRILTGDIWAHMWYLYLLLGLYLITPILCILVNNIKEKEYRIFLIILFLLSILINTINSLFNLNIAFNMIGISGYIFFYLYGYYIFKYKISLKYKIANYLLCILSIVYTVYFVINNANLDLMFSYTTFIPFIVASSLILFFKERNINFKINGLITSVGICGYGIYIYHQLFINIIYKVLKYNFIIYHPYIGILIYTFIIFIVSYIFTYLLRKIPLVCKYLA